MKTVDEILKNINEEQEYLKEKKQNVKELIEYLTNQFKDATNNKSYRNRMSSHLLGEVIKALVTAHNLDIQISNSLLKSYEQTIKLLKDLEKEDQDAISYSIIKQIEQALMSSDAFSNLNTIEGGDLNE